MWVQVWAKASYPGIFAPVSVVPSHNDEGRRGQVGKEISSRSSVQKEYIFDSVLRLTLEVEVLKARDRFAQDVIELI